MKLIPSYFITVYVIPKRVDEIINAVKSVTEINYGEFKWVYWVSEIGTEYYARESIDYDPTVKIEFSVPRDEILLKMVLEKIVKAHPRVEPVIRVCEARETRNRTTKS